MNLPTICTVLVFANQFRLTGKAALFFFPPINHSIVHRHAWDLFACHHEISTYHRRLNAIIK